MKQTLLLTCVVFLLFSASCNQANLSVGGLSCENLIDPLGIDNINPRLSWKVRSNRNGTEQKAYQILISGSRSLLEQDKGDLWDSGKTGSPSSVLVPYRGKSLSSGEIA